MTRLTTADLTPLYRNAIGVDRILNRVMNTFEQQSSTTGYPPYNIIKCDDNHYAVEVAVAGFTQGEIEVRVENNTLIVTGEKIPTDDGTHTDYIHQGISARKFIRTFSLAEYVEVIDATVENGILSVRLEQIVPDSLKPRNITVTYNR